MNTKEQFYSTMNKFESSMTFKQIHKEWYKCFSYWLKSIELGFSDEAIKSLFYDFDMENWTAMHKENTEYKDDSNNILIGHFCGECSYIMDRMSYDRLFRTHWLFRQGFNDELNKVRFPNISTNFR